MIIPWIYQEHAVDIVVYYLSKLKFFLTQYVRPGATPLPGDPASGIPGVPGSARPLGPAPIPSQGRGDWRPVSGRSFPGAPKGYNTNFGFPAWANSSARAFGIGLDFTLPSHK